MSNGPRVGLVLGAGGILGGAWLVGALDAIARETGWDPGSADRIVGTSAGSMIGGIPETQEMLDFCAEHGIVSDIELIRAEQINEAYERMLKGDVKYRFVIDNATLAP